MHKKMISDATFEQLKHFTCDMLDDLKITDHYLYEKYEMELYRQMYGTHFNKWMLEKALSKMENEDGTTGGHWTIDQTTSVGKQYGVDFTKVNEYDWNYAMNMIYSDYYGAVPNETSVYAKMAKKFVEDKDVCDGKAFRYYVSMLSD